MTDPLVLTSLGAGLAGLAIAATTATDPSLRAFRLIFPRDASPEQVVAFVRSLSGLLPPWYRRWLGTPAVVFEVAANERGLTHRLVASADHAGYVLAQLQAALPGTRIEQDQEKGKPVQVTVVTLLVNPEQAERLALASTEGKIQLALRNPLDQGAPETTGIKTAGLLGAVRTAPVRQTSGAHRAKAGPVTQSVPLPAPSPTVEMIRGDKRATEVIK